MTDRMQQEWNALAADANKLDDGKFLKIYRLLEQMAANPATHTAFDALRPRLTELKPPRRPTASRLFFRPAEDLLDDPITYSRRLNRISRGTLPPLWKAMHQHMPKGVLDAFQVGIAAADPEDPRIFVKLGEPLWQAGTEAVKAVLKSASDNMKYRNELFGRDEDALRQLEVIAELTAVGTEIETLKLGLPERPIGDLAESHVDTIKAALSALGRHEAWRARPLLLMLSARMKRPGDLLKLMADVRLGDAMGEKEGLTKELSSIVVGNLLRQTTEMEQAAPGMDQPGNLAATAERLTEGLNSVNETVQALKDKDMTKRIDQARQEIGDFVVRNIVSSVDEALVESLFGSPTVPATDEQVKQAEQLAMALRRSAKLAPQLGINREVTEKVQDVRKQVEAEAGQLLRSNPSGVGGMDPKVQRQMFNSLRVIEILAGSEEAERLYRSWTTPKG